MTTGLAIFFCFELVELMFFFLNLGFLLVLYRFFSRIGWVFPRKSGWGNLGKQVKKTDST